MVPLILFSDDTSGNRSKKWHKFESWFLSLAGLPRHLNPRTPDVALPIQMLRYHDTFVTSIVTFCAIDNQIRMHF